MKTLILFAALFALPALAADKAKGKHSEPTKEDRETMAKSHEDMAKCLRSDKPMKDCMDEMMKNCEGMGDKCPMHHHKGMRHGKGHGEHHEGAESEKHEE